MITFFGKTQKDIFAVSTAESIPATILEKLTWLFGNAPALKEDKISGTFIGPRATMITPWSTNAVEITQNMGISGVQRIEKFASFKDTDFDPMLTQRYESLTQDVFTIEVEPEPVRHITCLLYTSDAADE